MPRILCKKRIIHPEVHVQNFPKNNSNAVLSMKITCRYHINKWKSTVIETDVFCLLLESKESVINLMLQLKENLIVVKQYGY